MTTGMQMMTTLQEDWLECISSVTGMEALNDWNLSSWLPKEQKNVSFKHPLVTSCRYRPRETREECSRLYFTGAEIQTMREANRIRKQIEEQNRIREEMHKLQQEKRAEPRIFTPRFETVLIHGDKDVKVMYAVPKRRESVCARSF